MVDMKLNRRRSIVLFSSLLTALLVLSIGPALVSGVAPVQTTPAASPARLNHSPDSSYLTVDTESANGQPITGYYTLLYQGGNSVATGYSSARFSLANGQPYTLQVEGYGPCNFDHWADTGSTSASRNVSITSNTELTAIYSCTATAFLLPGPVPVTLNPSNTGLILIDVQSCSVQDPTPQPGCPAAIQADTPLVAQAVSLGMPILFTHEPAIANYTLPFSLNCPTCTAVTANTGDKFLNTTLGNWITVNHLSAVIIVGGSANSGVLIAATQTVRIFDISVVIPQNAVISANSNIQQASLWLMMNIGSGNLNNVPLAPGAVTLTNTTMISFG
jgi:nicotinamidase-related amidase